MVQIIIDDTNNNSLEAQNELFAKLDNLENVCYKKVEFDDAINIKDLYLKRTEMLDSLLFVDDTKEIKPTKLPKLVDFDWVYASRFLPEEDLILYVLESFYESIDENIEILESAFLKIDDKEILDKYQIKVHGIKSASAMVGGILISKMAYLLEMLSKEGRVEEIKNLHPLFIEEYKKVKQTLSEYYSK